MENEYKKAYVQILEILKYLPKENINKIPHKLIVEMEKNKSKNYRFVLDRTRRLNRQISDTSKAILANIYKQYWATDYEKKVINAKEISNRRKMEIIKLEKYPKEILFKNKKK